MKTFKKSYCPDSIEYKGQILTLDGYYSGKIAQANTPKEYIKQLEAKGKVACVVSVMSSKLKGKTDLYGNPYKPTTLIFSN